MSAPVPSSDDEGQHPLDAAPAQPFFVRLHIGSVTVLTVLFTVLLALGPPGGGGGFNFGLAFVLLPSMVLGLPWSAGLYWLFDLLPISGRTPVLATLALIGLFLPTIGNVWLHIVLYRRFRRRRGQPAPL